MRGVPGLAFTGGRMPKKARRERPPMARQVRPSYVPIVRKPGDEGSAFRRVAPAEPKVERQLLALLGTNAAVMVMGCVVVIMAVALIVLLIVKL
jgi:hypothetical protein